MKNPLNVLLKHVLKRFNRTVSYTPYAITGCHFPDDLREVVRREDPVCIDVGAHWGETVNQFQTLFARPVIHAVEPSRANLERLRAFESPGRVHIHHAALGTKNETLTLNLYEDSVLNSMLELDPAGPQGRNTRQGTEEVPGMTLDRLIQDQGLARVDLLKIDTQGYELPVLQGGAQSLDSGVVRAVLLEVNFSSIYSGQSPIQELFPYLQERGFAFVDFYQKARVGHALSWCNALFTQSKPS